MQNTNLFLRQVAPKRTFVSTGPNKVARRMNKMNLQAIAKKKFKVTTDSEHTKPIYENVLNRDFVTTKINQKWVGDISYFET